jgi:hypothetical protein
MKRRTTSRSWTGNDLAEMPAVGSLAERGPGALQPTVDRRHRGLQQLGDLGGAPTHHLSQDQHRPLAGGELLQGHHEGSATD